jgi:TrmH family RNA methyltransferase
VPTQPDVISSRRHPLVQRCRRIAAGSGERDDVLLDGEHLVREAVRSGVAIEAVLAVDADHAAVRAAVAAGAHAYAVTADVIDAASPVRTPTGIVAIAHWAPAPFETMASAAAALVVGLVDVQDPGNVGAVVRSADALGATGVVAIGASADPGSWKALRAAMGSTFRVPVARAAWPEVDHAATAHGLSICATSAGAGDPLDRVHFSSPTIVLVGNEGAGLPEAIRRRADRQVQVPMRAGVESLNVAVTASLVLYEASRQRALAPLRQHTD